MSVPTLPVNKLRNSMIYLCGPIDDADDHGIGWRESISKRLKQLGVLVLDPTNKPTDDFSESPKDHAIRQQLKDNGDFDTLHTDGQDIRNFDLRCVDKSDAIIVYLDMSIIMCGTIEELTIANLQQKPCLVFCKQGKQSIPNWIYWMLDPKYIFNNSEEIVDYLGDVNNGDIDDKRWKLFDFSCVKGT